MSMINYASREINCKLVYYGPGLGGKTTNLEFVYNKVAPTARGKMISLATETERTLFFDFLPVDLGTIRGFKVKFHLYTVPGQVYYNASRKLILKGVDGVVFVADSQIERMDANIEAMQNLYENMTQHGYDLTRIPFAVQYNKRDLPNAAPVAELQAALNPGWPLEDPAAAAADARPGPRVRVPGLAAGRAMDGAGALLRGGGGHRRRGVRHPQGDQQERRQDAGVGGPMWTLPNIITVVRICFTPVIALLPFIEGYWPKLIAFVIFLAAAISDVYDGYLARSRNEVTDLGKLLDPIADKLLLFATLIPIYFISRWRHDLYDIPIWGSIPLWVCLLLIGRELAMTWFRYWAKRRGRGDPGGRGGEAQDHDPEHLHRRRHPLVRLPRRPQADGLGAQPVADYWNQFHGGFVAVTLAVAALLTVYSFVLYLYRNRGLFSHK